MGPGLLLGFRFWGLGVRVKASLIHGHPVGFMGRQKYSRWVNVLFYVHSMSLRFAIFVC